MSVVVTEISELQNYLNGLVTRADHHAKEVNEIALALVGAVIWRKDPDPPIRLMSHHGEAKNAFWAQIRGTRYAFSYNHETMAIEMREGSLRGKPLYAFTNATPLSQIKQIFESL